MKQSLWHKVAKMDKSTSIRPTTAGNAVMWEIKLEDWKLGSFQDASFAGDMPDSKSTLGCLLCVFGSHTRLFPSSWMSKKRTAIFHSSAGSEIITLDAVFTFGWITALQFGECVLQTLSSEPTKVNLERHKCERFIPSRSHSDKCVFESIDHVPPNIPYSSHSTQLFIFEERCGSDPNDQQRTKSKPLARDKNAKSRFGWIVRENEFGSFCHFLKKLANKRSVGRYHDKRNAHFDAMACVVDFVATQMTVWSKWRPQFFSQAFLLLSFSTAPNNVSSDDTCRVCWPDVGSIRNKGIEIQLRSGQSSVFGAMEQSKVYLYTRQERSRCRNALRHECGGVENARGRSSRLLGCRSFFLCIRKQARNKPEIKVNNEWNDFLEQHRESARKIDGEQIQFRVHMFLGATTFEMVKIDEWIWQGQGEDWHNFTPETCPHRVLFSWKWRAKFWVLQKGLKERMRHFCKAPKEMQLTSGSSNPGTSCWKDPHRTNRTCLPAPLVCFHSTMFLKSRLEHFVCRPQYFMSLLRVSRTDVIGFCWYSAIAFCVATAFLGKESRCVSMPGPYTAHAIHSVVWWLQKTYSFHTLWVRTRSSCVRALGKGNHDEFMMFEQLLFKFFDSWSVACAMVFEDVGKPSAYVAQNANVVALSKYSLWCMASNVRNSYDSASLGTALWQDRECPRLRTTYGRLARLSSRPNPSAWIFAQADLGRGVCKAFENVGTLCACVALDPDVVAFST